MRHEHTTSLARCEIARDEPGAHPGQTCSAHRLAVTSRSSDKNGVTKVPAVAAVVVGCDSRLQGGMEEDRGHAPLHSPTSSDHLRADARDLGEFTLSGRDVHRGLFFYLTPYI